MQDNFGRIKLDGVTAGHQITLAKQEGRWNSHGYNGIRGGEIQAAPSIITMDLERWSMPTWLKVTRGGSRGHKNDAPTTPRN